MARTAQRLAIITAVTASFIAYLFHAPNSEGVEQVERVRGLTAVSKLTYLAVCHHRFSKLDYVC